MSITHLHLILNHVPVVGIFIGVLLLAYARLRRSDELQRVGLGFFVLLGLVTVAVFFTGEPAEEAVEHLPGFSKAITEQHEEAALAATVALSCIGALALAALVRFRRKALPAWLGSASLVIAVVASVPIANAANLGGQIRHTEIRGGAAAIDTNALQRESAGEHGER